MSVWIKISLSVLNGPLDNKSALFGLVPFESKPLHEPMLTQLFAWIKFRQFQNTIDLNCSKYALNMHFTKFGWAKFSTIMW